MTTNLLWFWQTRDCDNRNYRFQFFNSALIRLIWCPTLKSKYYVRMRIQCCKQWISESALSTPILGTRSSEQWSRQFRLRAYFFIKIIRIFAAPTYTLGEKKCAMHTLKAVHENRSYTSEFRNTVSGCWSNVSQHLLATEQHLLIWFRAYLGKLSWNYQSAFFFLSLLIFIR